MIATFTPCSKRAFSNFLEGVALKSLSGGKPPDSCLSSAPLPLTEVRCNAGLHPSILRGVGLGAF